MLPSGMQYKMEKNTGKRSVNSNMNIAQNIINRVDGFTTNSGNLINTIARATNEFRNNSTNINDHSDQSYIIIDFIYLHFWLLNVNMKWIEDDKALECSVELE
jgi:hypothetical protein